MFETLPYPVFCVEPAGGNEVTLVAAAATSATELFTPGGNDTLTCPIAAGAVIFPLAHLFGA